MSQAEPSRSNHPDLELEQGYIDYAYERLEAMRAAAARMHDSVIAESHGGTHQARFQRDVIVQRSLERLDQLDIGAEALCFGRIDKGGEERFYIGRRAVYGENQEPMVIDWRVPAAGPFYRATGRTPLGLSLRRHFWCEGRKLLDIEDERFSDEEGEGDLGLAATGSLLRALERGRTGHMRDIVATVQKEQDEIIRADIAGVLAVQGGPGTGKTAVALHRAAYLLFTYRKQLSRQGVLFVGPNRLFLRYVDRVLPALGETGVVLTTPSGLVSGVRVKAQDSRLAARVKGDIRMVEFIKRAVADRERALSEDMNVRIDQYDLRVTPKTTGSVVAGVKRGRRTHNGKRASVEATLMRRLHSQYSTLVARRKKRLGGGEEALSRREFEKDLAESDSFEEVLDYIWPVLTPQRFLHELYSDGALLESAARGVLSDEEGKALRRPAGIPLESAEWTAGDIPLMDEALTLLGVVDADRIPEDDLTGEDGIPVYGHIVVDEVQDLSPMQLRMLRRRSISGSMTIVGDIAQATGPTAPDSWDDVLEHLPTLRGSSVTELSINYRTPTEIMTRAGRVLSVTAPQLDLPRSIRSSGHEPEFIRVAQTELLSQIGVHALRLSAEDEKVAIICSPEMYDEIAKALEESDVPFGHAETAGLDASLTLISVDIVKGLEFDSVILVEPWAVVESSPQGMRAIYVAMTRATKRLVVIHEKELPQALS